MNGIPKLWVPQGIKLVLACLKKLHKEAQFNFKSVVASYHPHFQFLSLIGIVPGGIYMSALAHPQFPSFLPFWAAL